MNTVSHWLTTGRDWLGFIFVWPVGLALLFYMIWSNRMNRNFMAKRMGRRHMQPFHSPSTGNSAFDSYRDETLKRLEDEQNAFQSFIERLREAKDKAEFEQFMDDRSKPDTLKGAEPA